MALAAVAVVAVGASIAQAAPIVTMTEGTLSGNKVLDFYYSASAGAEFTNYNLQVTSSNGANILDPVRTSAGWWDQGGDANDTWANTPFSLLFGSAPSSVFQVYKPTAPSQSPIPTAALKWEIFDNEVGDTNNVDTGDTSGFPPDGIAHAPWHLARVLVAPTGTGVVVIDAFDTASGGISSLSTFQYGATVPEPATLSLLGLALVGFVGVFRRR